ncbi:hypothetical protein LOD99_11747 [Oopsacas minuta]|uniref:Uncharacterized protein n=1 Tax=Oopsacas minuta TaxID=111878 RepID=A0AAV7JKD3_9METZ|nr:hypothetical protein LOD99_11747 [Oopsacas minuta]
MATRISPEEIDKEEFLFGLEIARSALRERVSELKANIHKIEKELSEELNKLEKEFTNKQSEYKNKMSSLTAIRINIEDQFKSGEFEDLKKSILSDTDKKIEALDREYPPHSVELVWKEGVGDQLKEIGNVVVSEGRREVKQKKIKLDNYITESSRVNVERRVKRTIDKMAVEQPVAIPPVIIPPVAIPPVIHARITEYELRRKPIITVSLLGCQYPQGIAYDYIAHAVYVLDNISCNLYCYSLVTEKVKKVPFASFMLVNRKEFFIQGDYYSSIIGDGRIPYISGHNSIMGISYIPGNSPLNREPKPEVVYFSPQPYGIEFQNNILYISAKSRNIVTHDLIASISLRDESQDKYISSCDVFGKHGSLEGEMNTPTGLAYSDPNLYVCDSKNNRINVYYKNDRINVYSIGGIVKTITHSSLYQPLDIKIHKNSLFVLNSKYYLILQFDLRGDLLSQFLSRESNDLMPSFFCIDSSGRLLITDNRKPYVYVFMKDNRRYTLQTSLELKHGEERLVEPRGVCIDKKGRVIVVCNYKEAMLQIF